MRETRPWMIAVRKHVRLALIYADDGACVTSAKMLVEAANLLVDEQNRKNRILSGNGKNYNPVRSWIA